MTTATAGRKRKRKASERRPRRLRAGYDDGLADRAVRFIEALTHDKGELAGQTLTLQPWQRDFVGQLFGTLDESGHRRYRYAYLEIPRKNGKSTICAAIALYLLFMDREPGAEVYSAAADRDQARVVFETAKRMVEANPVLAARAKIYKNTIEFAASGSIYKVLSADAPTKHGLNPHGVIFDELHVQRNRDLWEALTTGTGARRQPLVAAITTAGWDRNSLCWQIHQHARRVIDGDAGDGRWLCRIYAAPTEADWTSEQTWRAANPNYGVTVNPQYMIEQAALAKESAAHENTFRQLHLNQWTEQAVRFLRMEDWDHAEASAAVDPQMLAGRSCYAGLDLATTTDLTSLVLWFPDSETDRHVVLPYFFVPRDNARLRERRDHVPYLQWAREGLIELTEGDVTDYAHVRRRIRELAQVYRIREIAVDRLFQGAQLSTELQQDGHQVIAFGQGFYSMAAPTSMFERLVISHAVRHGGNPVMRWMAANVTVARDPAGNLKPDKSRSIEKIDGIVAAIMALGRVMAAGNPASRYEERGPLIIGATTNPHTEDEPW